MVNWSIFYSLLAMFLFLGVRATVFARLKAMIDAGVPISIGQGHPLIVASNLLTLLSNINVIVFTVVYAFKIGIFSSLTTVIGSYVSALAIAMLIRRTVLEMVLIPLDKIAWVAIPVLSILIWFQLYGVAVV